MIKLVPFWDQLRVTFQQRIVSLLLSVKNLCQRESIKPVDTINILLRTQVYKL